MPVFTSKLLERVITEPWIYNQIQKASGREWHKQRLKPHLAGTSYKVILDVGAGTGTCRSLISEHAHYIGLDIDPKKLSGISNTILLVGDATHLSLPNNSVDWALCIAVAHHLNDQQLPYLFSEMARVVREKIFFLDAVDCPDLLTGRLLWKIDRGSWPRPAEALIAAIECYFEIEHIEQYNKYHRYLMCTARPKNF